MVINQFSTVHLLKSVQLHIFLCNYVSWYIVTTSNPLLHPDFSLYDIVTDCSDSSLNGIYTHQIYSWFILWMVTQTLHWCSLILIHTVLMIYVMYHIKVWTYDINISLWSDGFLTDTEEMSFTKESCAFRTYCRWCVYVHLIIQSQTRQFNPCQGSENLNKLSIPCSPPSTFRVYIHDHQSLTSKMPWTWNSSQLW